MYSNTCLSQHPLYQLSKAKVDSVLNSEIMNYREVQKELSLKISNLTLGSILQLTNEAQVIQFNLGLTGYKVRVLFHPGDASIYLVSFGRSDYVEYFKTGFDKVIFESNKHYPHNARGVILSDALLPDCFDIYLKEGRDSMKLYKRTFYSSYKSDKKILSPTRKSRKQLIWNSIFADDIHYVSLTRHKYFIEKFATSGQVRMQLFTYAFHLIDVIPISITKAMKVQ